MIELQNADGSVSDLNNTPVGVFIRCAGWIGPLDERGYPNIIAVEVPDTNIPPELQPIPASIPGV